jgi:hypothetical protein
MTTAAVNTSRFSLLDHVKMRDPDGSIAPIVEVLARQTPLLEDATWIEGNLDTGHQFTSRVGLPTASYRMFNKGDSATKSKYDQFTEACARLGTRMEIDAKLAELGGNLAQTLSNEEKGHTMALTTGFEEGAFYNNIATDPERFQGFAPRLTSTTGRGGSQIVLHSAAAADYQTSIWGIQWGPNTVTGIFPKGSKAGFSREFIGKVDALDADSKPFRAYAVDWEWQPGLMVKDFGGIVRIANIDISALSGTDDTLVPAMIKAYHKFRNRAAGKIVWYCGRTVATYLDLQARASVKGGGGLGFANQDGEEILAFRGAPIRTTDGIKDTEDVIS